MGEGQGVSKAAMKVTKEVREKRRVRKIGEGVLLGVWLLLLR